MMVGYIPETELDAARRGKREAGTPQYTTIMLPYSYAVAMTAYSYWATTFLSRSPVFQFMDLTAIGADGVLAVEALQQYQVMRGRMMPHLYIWLQDVPKYGEAWVSPFWKTEVTRTSEIIEQPDLYMGMLEYNPPKVKKVRQVTETIGYSGNALFNVAPATVLTDPRYTRSQFQKGEFVAVEITMSYQELREGAKKGRYINVDKVKRKSGAWELAGYSTTIASEAESVGLERPDITSFGSSVSDNADDALKGYEFIIKLVPSDWELGTGDWAEKWVFTVDKDFEVLLEARPQGCLHDQFPLALLEIEPEGYGSFSRSLVEIFGPVQQTLDWLVNTHFFNVRQVLNNQWLLDPSRVETRDLETGKPGKAIRLKPAAYGTDIRTALMQLPVQDVTKSHFGDIQFMYDIGDKLGVNASLMGETNPQSRRTGQEYRGEQALAVNKLKVMAEFFSCTGFADLSNIMVKNSQQYYDGAKKLRIVGDLAQYAGQEFIQVTPENIVGQFDWAPVDGTLPIDRYAQANLWREMLAQMAQVPQVMMQYDLGKIFGFVAQLSGLKNIDRFKIQMMPDQMMMAQAGAGNAVPMLPGPGMGNPVEPGQVPLNGPTA
jgi:hypothetical protein